MPEFDASKGLSGTLNLQQESQRSRQRRRHDVPQPPPPRLHNRFPPAVARRAEFPGPMNEARLKVAPVIRSASSTPEVESAVEASIATGAEKLLNSYHNRNADRQQGGRPALRAAR
ncbi:MAG TPA: hypothetical protein VGW37_17335 [Terriglobia bacterium]|nr:hypothetical protein [Terriglobia bacterium]